MGDEDKIGAAKHTGRNVGVLVGVVALGAGIWWFQMSSKKQDQGKLADLESFRAAYAQKCEAPAFAGKASEVLVDAYLNSATLPGAVQKQLTLLNSGTSCDEVTRALKAADFPMLAVKTTAK